jgi:omega-amidase
MKIPIVLVQLHIQPGDPQANLDRVLSLLSATPMGAWVLLPELWSTGYALADGPRLAVENQAILERLADWAIEHQCCVGGSTLQSRHGKIYNTFHWLRADKQRIEYSKIHLFGLMDENCYLAPGSQTVLTDAGSLSAGLSICYDLRFPELFRQYALNGVTCFFNVAEWPLRRLDHWKILLRARAIENQAFMIAVNAADMTLGQQFGGCSAVITPWGECLVEGPEAREALLTCEIDTDEVAFTRQRINVFQDRRSDLYGDCQPGQ